MSQLITIEDGVIKQDGKKQTQYQFRAMSHARAFHMKGEVNVPPNTPWEMRWSIYDHKCRGVMDGWVEHCHKDICEPREWSDEDRRTTAHQMIVMMGQPQYHGLYTTYEAGKISVIARKDVWDETDYIQFNIIFQKLNVKECNYGRLHKHCVWHTLDGLHHVDVIPYHIYAQHPLLKDLPQLHIGY